MPNETQRPPRYPLQNKSINIKQSQSHDRPGSCIGLAPKHQHCKSLSESYINEEKPPWFDDLLGDQESDSYSSFNLNSSSYSFTFLDVLNELGTSTSSESNDKLESSCAYGPNSPKRISQLTFQVSSAFSNSVSQSSLLQNLDASAYESERAQPGTIDNTGTNDEFSNETMPTKGLHPRQRRRAWKLQYIAELERTVSTLQTFELELATKVSVLFQQRSTLQMENSKLKQKIIRLQQESLVADGQYRSLRKEVAMLKARLSSHSHMNKTSTLKGLSSGATLVGSKPSWQILDLWKLDLN